MVQTGQWALILPDALRRVIRRDAQGEDAVEILAAADQARDRLVAYLEPLLGNAGAHALLKRSMTLARREHPELADPLAANVAQASRQDPEVVMESSVAVLVIFVNLLASFIGERLTIQVLCQVWPAVAPLLRSIKESS